jgi:hypothetical protein
VEPSAVRRKTADSCTEHEVVGQAWHAAQFAHAAGAIANRTPCLFPIASNGSDEANTGDDDGVSHLQVDAESSGQIVIRRPRRGTTIVAGAVKTFAWPMAAELHRRNTRFRPLPPGRFEPTSGLLADRPGAVPLSLGAAAEIELASHFGGLQESRSAVESSGIINGTEAHYYRDLRFQVGNKPKS